jgi:lipoate-protein ligase A
MRSSLSESSIGLMDAFSYIDEPRSGLMNMAIDDAMLDFADERRAVVLRLYQWAEPTLSLGYFQRISERTAHLSSMDLPVVRRATGGGAIVHHHDLTYSVVVPQSSSSVGAAPAIYAAVHGAIVELLNELGLAATQWRETYNLPTIGVQPAKVSKSEFLCFHRRSDGDVVVGEHKLLGSAQRRSKGALLQHGSLLLATSQHAPSLIGLQELLPNEGGMTANSHFFAEEMRLRIQRGIDALLAVRIQCGQHLIENFLSPAAVRMTEFGSPKWLDRA